MKTQIQIFNNPQFGNVRVAVNENNEPLFCLADICQVLDLKNPSKVKSRLIQKGVTNSYTLTNGGAQSMTYINEANLYRCVFQSRKPDAEKFQDWVFEEVLPSIRKTGGYVVRQKVETSEEFLARAVLASHELLEKKDRMIEMQRETIRRQEKQMAQDAPKLAFADAMTGSKGSCHFSLFANVLGRNGVKIGQKRLFQWMRDHGYLGTAGCFYNKPVQRYVNMGVLEVEVQTFCVDGVERLNFVPKITSKGMRYFFDKLIREKEFFPRLDLGIS